MNSMKMNWAHALLSTEIKLVPVAYSIGDDRMSLSHRNKWEAIFPCLLSPPLFLAKHKEAWLNLLALHLKIYTIG